MSYPEPQRPRDWAAAWVFVGVMFLVLVVASLVVEMAQKRPDLKAGSPSAHTVERKAVPARRAERCCGPYDEPRPTAR